MICVHDIIAVAGLAIRVSIAYKDAPNDYRHISKEATALKTLVDKATPHVKGTTISGEDHHYGKKVLKECQSVLEDLDSFISKYKRLASLNKRLVLNSVKLGKKDITVLHEQLVSKTVLFNGFVRRCVVNCPLHQSYRYILIPILIPIFTIDVNMLKPKHSWLLFSAFTSQSLEFQ